MQACQTALDAPTLYRPPQPNPPQQPPPRPDPQPELPAVPEADLVGAVEDVIHPRSPDTSCDAGSAKTGPRDAQLVKDKYQDLVRWIDATQLTGDDEYDPTPEGIERVRRSTSDYINQGAIPKGSPAISPGPLPHAPMFPRPDTPRRTPISPPVTKPYPTYAEQANTPAASPKGPQTPASARPHPQRATTKTPSPIPALMARINPRPAQLTPLKTPSPPVPARPRPQPPRPQAPTPVPTPILPLMSLKVTRHATLPPAPAAPAAPAPAPAREPLPSKCWNYGGSGHQAKGCPKNWDNRPRPRR